MYYIRKFKLKKIREAESLLIHGHTEWRVCVCGEVWVCVWGVFGVFGFISGLFGVMGFKGEP